MIKTIIQQTVLAAMATNHSGTVHVGMVTSGQMVVIPHM
jgi:hypothetical protein